MDKLVEQQIALSVGITTPFLRLVRSGKYKPKPETQFVINEYLSKPNSSS